MLPVTYALSAGALVTAVDHKPKHVPPERLARLRWLRAKPRAALTVDHYEEDWSRLAWVQAIGPARILDAADAPEAVAALASRYSALSRQAAGRPRHLAHARPPRLVASVGRYALGLAALAIIAGALGLAALAIRRRVLADWTGAPAVLAEAVIGLALLIGILEMLGLVGWFALAPIVIACVIVGAAALAWARPAEPRRRATPARAREARRRSAWASPSRCWAAPP